MTISLHLSPDKITGYLKVFPYENSFTHVEVWKSRTFIHGEYLLGPARVNWSALGETTPNDASLYAAAIKLASELAEKWDELGGEELGHWLSNNYPVTSTVTCR